MRDERNGWRGTCRSDGHGVSRTRRTRSARRAVSLAFVAILVAGAVSGGAAQGAGTPVAASAPGGSGKPWNAPLDAATLASLTASERAAGELASELGAFGRVEVDPTTGTVRIAQRLDGYLTAERDARPTRVARDYVRANRAVFGLSSAEVGDLVLSEAWTSRGLTHLVFAQTVEGVPMIDHGIVANVDSDGRLINIGGAPAVDPVLRVAEARLSGAQALLRAEASVGGPMSDPANGPRGRALVPGSAAAVPPRLRVFVGSAGARLVWRVVARSDTGEAFDVVVDASDGTILRSHRLTLDAVDARVFRHHPGAASGGTQEDIDITPYVDSRLSSRGLVGPFAYAFTDVNDSETIQSSEEVLPSSGDDYLFTFQAFDVASGNCAPYSCSWNHTVANSWQTNRRQAAVQAFYFANRFHDHLAAAPISFTPMKGAFEGNTRVWVNAQVGAALNGGLPDDQHVNNAFMQTFPTGPPLMNLFLTRPLLTYEHRTGDTADDASVVFHEYAHGLSNKLIVDADGFGALYGRQSSALGEGWSDWYAMDYLVGQGLVTDSGTAGEVLFAPYQGSGTGAWRFQPLDCPVGSTAAGCPGTPDAGTGGFTYGDMGKIQGYAEPHGDGEIWSETLWDLRSRLVADHGATEGVRRTRLLVTRGMELSPLLPTFLDMRNAILQADTAFNGGADRNAIWSVFAKRGMGYYAATNGTSDTRPAQSFALPPASSSTGTVAGTVRNEFGAVLPGAHVWIGGFDAGLPSDLEATADAAGRYTIPSVPIGTYKRVIAATGGGYDIGVAKRVAVSDGVTTTRSFALRRDWASSQGGASVTAFTGPDFTEDFCGPAQAIDGTANESWVTTSPVNPDAPGVKSITVRLPTTVNVSSFAIDPSVGCVRGITASLGRFRIRTSTDGVNFVTSASGRFTQEDTFRLNPVVPDPGTTTNVRYVRLIAQSSQDMTEPHLGAIWMVVTELEVYGTAT